MSAARLLVVVHLFLLSAPAIAEAQLLHVGYGRDGVEFGQPESPFRVTVGGRVQFRYSDPFADDPLDPEELDRDRQNLTNIRRARVRSGGHLFTPRLDFTLQYDLVNTWLLDAHLNYEVRSWLQLRGGQWKPEFNRERVASSAEQPLVERSLVNQVFNIDRQNGVMVHGRAGRGRPIDSTYWVGVFNGGGRSRGNDDRRPMWLARYQWNAAGGGMDFTGVDLDRTRTLRLILAVAANGNQTGSPRVGTNGPDLDEDSPNGEPGQYRVAQWVGEAAWRWRGASMQHEYHWKQVANRLTGDVRRLHGMYVQAGCFPDEVLPLLPAPLELTARFAVVDPEVGGLEDHRQEVTVGANWYLDRHRRKVSADVSRLGFDTPDGFAASSVRVRLQLEVAF